MPPTQNTTLTMWMASSSDNCEHDNGLLVASRQAQTH